VVQQAEKNRYSKAEIDAWLKDVNAKTELGVKFPTARALYDYLKKQAHGGTKQTYATLPDWTGLWTRDYRPDGGHVDAFGANANKAQLTPEYAAEFKKRMDDGAKGILFDPLSDCFPAGMPRWITEPFLKELVDTPDETWLISEQMNEIRRVYTDGRDHTPEADRYPLWEGDSIGFWDGQKLVVHTDEMDKGIYGRTSPSHSDQVEVVEIWQRVSKLNVDVDAWMYDPAALKAPWFVKFRLVQQPNPDKFFRIRQWECNENPNNVVIKDASGASNYQKLDFEHDRKPGESLDEPKKQDDSKK
jgi:hypothetical protein